MNVKKSYVKVMSQTDEEGRTRPILIELHEKRYVIDELLDERQAASLKTGGQGIRYTVRIGRTETYLFFEKPRWYVEEKIM